MLHEEDSVSQEIEISNTADWIKFNNPTDELSSDPFDINGEDLKKINGIGPTFKRKISRTLEKRFVGVDGAQTQQNLLAQAITGYAMFDLVQPPYNLEYLAQVGSFSKARFS